jgi:formamidopyrimidine-DNA glycosylase
MPELPEVDTVCWRLREGGHGEPPLVGRTLVSLSLDDPTVLRTGTADDVGGGRFVAITRRAKWITVHVSLPVVTADRDLGRHAGAGRTPTAVATAAATAATASTTPTTTAAAAASTKRLLVHLVMTGDLHVVPTLPARFVRWRAQLDDGTWLVFTDPRRFGHLDIIDDDAPFFADLGVEPLSDDFTVAVLAGLVRAGRGRRAVKAVLLDQSIVAGLGNIWADESLHVAGIDPRRALADLDDDEHGRLREAVQTTLRQAIAEAREELVWRYGNTTAPSPFRVYDRGGEPCRRCRATLATTKIAGRTTVWCPRCQPAR